MTHRYHTYIARCCRDWIAPAGYAGGTCGLCGQHPTYHRPDDHCGCGCVTPPTPEPTHDDNQPTPAAATPTKTST